MAKDLLRLGCALVLGAAVAFPAGMMVARRGGQELPASRASPAAPAAALRNPYSPDVLRDPHVLAEQRKLAAALQAECARSGQYCAEAEQARDWSERAPK